MGDEHVVLLSAVALKRDMQGQICFQLNYPEGSVNLEEYNVYYDPSTDGRE